MTAEGRHFMSLFVEVLILDDMERLTLPLKIEEGLKYLVGDCEDIREKHFLPKISNICTVESDNEQAKTCS